jgi:hypothetical protein
LTSDAAEVVEMGDGGERKTMNRRYFVGALLFAPAAALACRPSGDCQPVVDPVTFVPVSGPDPVTFEYGYEEGWDRSHVHISQGDKHHIVRAPGNVYEESSTLDRLNAVAIVIVESWNK